MDLETYRAKLRTHLSAYVTEQGRASLKLAGRLSLLNNDASVSRLERVEIDRVTEEETERALSRMTAAAQRPTLS